MNPSTLTQEGPATGHRALHVALWIAQVLLAALFLFAGSIKLAKPAMVAEQGHLSLALVIFIGVSEVAGGLGVLLPALTRVRPALTPLAAVGLAAILVLAICFHLIRGEASHTPIPLAFLALAVFVAWGRSVKAPISPRTPPSP